MNVQEGLDALKQMKQEAGPEAKLGVYIQTGPDSFEWKAITHFAPFALAPLGVIVEVGYGGEIE